MAYTTNTPRDSHDPIEIPPVLSADLVAVITAALGHPTDPGANTTPGDSTDAATAALPARDRAPGQA